MSVLTHWAVLRCLFNGSDRQVKRRFQHLAVDMEIFILQPPPPDKLGMQIGHLI